MFGGKIENRFWCKTVNCFDVLQGGKINSVNYSCNNARMHGNQKKKKKR